MSNFKLNLPTDIPWQRICVTEDMIDTVVCDERLPAKWHTSLAVFKYVPAAEYQLYPDYDITYMKVTATITGYQPLDKEIQGSIDWNGVDADTEFTNQVLKDLLNTYHPCNGAILQVVVGPHGENPDMPLIEYPFFLDFEPKKRELYELATDTKEKSSRSIESLNITKSAGSTQSLEILDVDMGGGGFGANASYAGTGGGFTYTAPNGQWGTKRLNADESLASRSSDVGQEKRETYSFSTQISQMYHLLDSYHLGTNRIIFFIQPRPHTLEEPSGFVRGPRPVDGIQEFFMVVARPKGQDEFCVSLRLDTSHLTKVDLMDYELRTVTSGVVSTAVPVPQFSENDVLAKGYAPAGEYNLYRACFGGCWDVPYLRWTVQTNASETVDAPAGYVIQSITNVRNESSHGSTSVAQSAANTSVTISVQANGLIYQELGKAVCANCPDWVDGYYGSAARQVQLNLRSTTPTIKTGEQEMLMITTRGLCCCSSHDGKEPMDEFVVDFKPIPEDLSIQNYLDEVTGGKKGGKPSYTHMEGNVTSQTGEVEDKPQITITGKKDDHSDGPCKECEQKYGGAKTGTPDAKYTIRLANELSRFIKDETIKSLNDPTVKLQKYTQTEFFAKQFENQITQYNKGKKILSADIQKEVPGEVISKVAKYLRKEAKQVNRKDLLSIRGSHFSRIAGLSSEEVQKIKLGLMGVKFSPKKANTDEKHNRKKGTK